MAAVLSNDPIDPAMVAQGIALPSHGAVVTFIGVVRDHHDGRPVRSLEYSAYQAMVEAVGEEIAREAESRFGARPAIRHRIGVLAIGDVAVVVAAAAPHRDAAFDAARWVIDEVKRRLPVWKHEHYLDGTSAWVDPSTAGALLP